VFVRYEIDMKPQMCILKAMSVTLKYRQNRPLANKSILVIQKTLVARMITIVITVIFNNGRMLSKEEERQYLAMWSVNT